MDLKDKGARLSCKPVNAEIVADENGIPCDLRVCYESGATSLCYSHPTVATFEGVLANFTAHLNDPATPAQVHFPLSDVSSKFELPTGDSIVHLCVGAIHWQVLGSSHERLLGEYQVRLDIEEMPEFWTEVSLKVEKSEEPEAQEPPAAKFKKTEDCKPITTPHVKHVMQGVFHGPRGETIELYGEGDTYERARNAIGCNLHRAVDDPDEYDSGNAFINHCLSVELEPGPSASYALWLAIKDAVQSIEHKTFENSAKLAEPKDVTPTDKADLTAKPDDGNQSVGEALYRFYLHRTTNYHPGHSDNIRAPPQTEVEYGVVTLGPELAHLRAYLESHRDYEINIEMDYGDVECGDKFDHFCSSCKESDLVHDLLLESELNGESCGTACKKRMNVVYHTSHMV